MSDLTLSNDRLELSIDSQTGAISRILGKKASLSYLRDAPKQAFYIWVLQTGKKSGPYANDDEPFRALSSSSFRLIDASRKDGSDGSSVETSHVLGSFDIKCRYYLRKQTELVDCEIGVNNRSKGEHPNPIVAIGFPQVQGISFGRGSKDSILVRPNRFGEKIPDPIGNVGMYHDSILYGGMASMMWMDFYDRQGGMYMASYDKTLLLTALESIPDADSGTMRIGFRKYAFVPPAGDWRSQPFVIGVHEGDWHWAADRYRDWARSWMAQPRVPEDIRQMDGWYGANFKQGTTVPLGFKDIARLYDDAQYLGLSHVQLWGQMVGDSCCYRFYYPDPRLGTVEELKKAISDLRSRGCRIGFYFNIQAFSPYIKEYLSKRGYRVPNEVEIPDWAGEFKNYAQTNFDGAATIQYPGRESEDDGFRIMCTFSKGWQDYLVHWVVQRYLKEYGADFAYIDQAFSPPVSYCFNFGHGHDHHGCSAQGRVSLVKRISEEGRDIDADFSICIEGNGDSIGQFSDLHLYTSFSSQTRFPAPEVFAYTFPDYIIIDGFANSPADWIGRCYYPDIQKEPTLEDLMNRVYLLGFRFDVTLPHGEPRIKRGHGLTEHIKKLIRLRRKTKQIQYNSTFTDDIGLKCTCEGVAAKCFRSIDQNNLLVNFVDYRTNRGPFTISIDRSVHPILGHLTATMYTIDEEVFDLVPKTTDKTVDVVIPDFAGKVASLLLSRM